jgi:predicted nucleotidyltransferase
MGIKNYIGSRLGEFKDLCVNHHVKSLYAFGSGITNNFDPTLSDIDLLVEMEDTDPIERGEKLLNLWDKLEDFFNKKVDLLTDSSIRNPILRKSIDRTKILIYDGEGQEVLI